MYTLPSNCIHFPSYSILEKRITVATLSLLALIFALPPVSGALQGPISVQMLKSHSCALPDYGSGFCFRFSVPENRKTRNGRQLQLYVVYLPPYSKRKLDAITPLAGGPGEGSATDMQGYFSKSDVRLLRVRHALLFIDARGTGLSDPIGCFTGWRDAQTYLTMPVPLLPLNELRKCRSSLSARADIEQYNSVAEADDVDDIRAALGIRKLTLLGFSAGSLTAQMYLRRHTQYVRAIVMGGIETPDFHHPAPSARARQIALDAVFSACSKDDDCNSHFPNLSDDYLAALRIARSHPINVSVSEAGPRVEISYAVFADRLGVMLYSRADVSKIPDVIHQAASGNWSSFARVALADSMAFYSPTDSTVQSVGISKGMYLSSVCSEGVPFILQAEVTQARDTFTGQTRIDAYRQACEIWNVRSAAQDFTDPVTSSVPTLMISNRFDPACPWWIARAMLRNWSNARQVTDLSFGHLDDWDCIKGMTIQFIDSLKPGSIATACATNPPRIHFAEQV